MTADRVRSGSGPVSLDGHRRGPRTRGGLIAAVEAGSLAAAAGLRAGDRLLEVGSFEIQDLIDYRYHSAEDFVRLRLLRDGAEVAVEIQKDPDQDLGLAFEDAVFDRIRRCANRCEFCFIHQMPEGLRDSLYVEDDDYRLSFLQGNFITLTNLAEKDWQRITAMRLSPLYISIHTTDPELRREMLRQPLATRLHAQLDRLAASRIDFHAQIVLVPGRNDGPELARTLEELVSRWWPRLLTVCVVPFGATRFRKPLGLPALRQATPDWCREVVRLARGFQRRFKKEYGDPIVRLADEFYVEAGLRFPGVAHYAGFPSLGDGVGGGRLLLSEWARTARRLPPALSTPCRATIVTGRAAESILRPIADRLNAVERLTVRVLPIRSRHWGDDITVTGLLTGLDVAAGLSRYRIGGTVWLPDIMLRAGTRTFLDDRTVEDVASETGAGVQVLTTDARGFFTAATEPERLPELAADRWFGSYYR